MNMSLKKVSLTLCLYMLFFLRFYAQSQQEKVEYTRHGGGFSVAQQYHGKDTTIILINEILKNGIHERTSFLFIKRRLREVTVLQNQDSIFHVDINRRRRLKSIKTFPNKNLEGESVNRIEDVRVYINQSDSDQKRGFYHDNDSRYRFRVGYIARKKKNTIVWLNDMRQDLGNDVYGGVSLSFIGGNLDHFSYRALYGQEEISYMNFFLHRRTKKMYLRQRNSSFNSKIFLIGKP